MHWDPDGYREFTDQRSRPFVDLLSRITPQQPRYVVDLGCGSGELTALLARTWPEAQVHGIDSSAAMIEDARTRAAARPAEAGLTFEVRDLTAWTPGPHTDVVLSNAALQWVPQHRDLLTAWARALGPGAWLAWQVPANFDEPAHALMREIAARPHWRRHLDGALRHRGAVAEPGAYADLLLDAGLEADVWETTYLHLLSGPDPVLRWMRGTGLRPVHARLPATEIAAFEAEYAQELRAAYPPGPHGTRFPFRRILCVGHVPHSSQPGRTRPDS
ncbi:trans-aconitate 2-methyltransferase [Lipingzhangella sp. LS1_29]|uniref:Trans-aconitate 2-methyltransferase n=1 Tax=Lipingzhangella rawalii TaxID=2055835 RepID=A0ABU2H6B5_9ACTN|nr:trans-aconitate 2-methyltransferase [Lipingzhangella rawalii]MDS1270838.1 trans-aconitate 2-methyltransferase [Lipingzhangella rawalii]